MSKVSCVSISYLRGCELIAGTEAAEPFHDVGHSEFALEQNLGDEMKRVSERPPMATQHETTKLRETFYWIK